MIPSISQHVPINNRCLDNLMKQFRYLFTIPATVICSASKKLQDPHVVFATLIWNFQWFAKLLLSYQFQDNGITRIVFKIPLFWNILLVDTPVTVTVIIYVHRSRPRQLCTWLYPIMKESGKKLTNCVKLSVFKETTSVSESLLILYFNGFAVARG